MEKELLWVLGEWFRRLIMRISIILSLFELLEVSNITKKKLRERIRHTKHQNSDIVNQNLQSNSYRLSIFQQGYHKIFRSIYFIFNHHFSFCHLSCNITKLRPLFFRKTACIILALFSTPSQKKKRYKTDCNIIFLIILQKETHRYQDPYSESWKA